MSRLLLIVAGAVSAILASTASSALAAPGVPAAPKVIFAEDFENVADPTMAEFLTAYTGAAPMAMTYTADPAWVSGPACNGLVGSFNSGPGATGCAGGTYTTFVRPIFRALGGGVGVGEDNQGMSDVTVTGFPAPSTPAATLQTAAPIPLLTTNRFLNFSVDIGVVTCGGAHPRLRFFLLDGATEIPATQNAVDPCTDPRGGLVGTVRVGSYPSDTSILVASPAVGLKLTNDQTSGSGNDYAIDNVRMLDATPQLDKSFSAGQATVGDTVRLTFTVTNTSELAQKAGWTLTDSLPSGMSVAPVPNVATDCIGGTLTAAGSSITVGGGLATGQASCTASLDVKLTKAGSISNGAANLTVTGLDEPTGPPATVVVDEPKLKVTQKVSKRKLKPGQKTTLTAKATNTSGATLHNVKVCETLPSGLTAAGSKPKAAMKGNKLCHTFKTLDPGETVSLKVKARAAAGSCGPLNARASATAPDVDGDRARSGLRVTCPLAAGGVTG